MVNIASTVAIEAQDCQWTLAGAHVGLPSLWQMPCGQSLKRDPQTQEAVNLGFCY